MCGAIWALPAWTAYQQQETCWSPRSGSLRLPQPWTWCQHSTDGGTAASSLTNDSQVDERRTIVLLLLLSGPKRNQMITAVLHLDQRIVTLIWSFRINKEIKHLSPFGWTVSSVLNWFFLVGTKTHFKGFQVWLQLKKASNNIDFTYLRLNCFKDSHRCAELCTLVSFNQKKHYSDAILTKLL